MFPVLAVFLLAQATLCDTETIRIPGTTVDLRTLGDCGPDKTENALWHLDRLDSLDGHLDGSFARVPAHALVYVIDLGVEKDHTEFAEGNVIGGINVALPSESCRQPELHPCVDMTDDFSLNLGTHGTGVASLIGGRRVGVAPGTFIVSVMAAGKFRDGTPYGADVGFIDALDAIVAHAWDPATPQVKTAIVNMSFQAGPLQFDTDPFGHSVMAAKIRAMTNGVDRNGNPDPSGKRFLFTVAAGNAADNHVTPESNRGQCGPDYEVLLFPASLGPSISGLITVGGMTKANTMWKDTCRGNAVELFAPSENIFVAINTAPDHYRLWLDSGTSWAAPIVAGVAARMLTANPNLTPQEIEFLLESSPTAISDPPPGPANGRVVHLAPERIPARRRSTSH